MSTVFCRTRSIKCLEQDSEEEYHAANTTKGQSSRIIIICEFDQICAIEILDENRHFVWDNCETSSIHLANQLD